MLGFDNPIHLLFLGILLLLVFGARRLPEMGRSLGAGMRGFKESLSGEGSQPAELGRRSAQHDGCWRARPRAVRRWRAAGLAASERAMAVAIGRIGHEDRLSVVDHLEELRARLIVCLAAIALAFGVCVWQNHALLRIVNRPLAHQTQKQVRAGNGPAWRHLHRSAKRSYRRQPTRGGRGDASATRQRRHGAHPRLA